MNTKKILGSAAMFAAAAGASLTLAAPAIAAPLFSASNVIVKVSGGEAIALNECIQDARDGVIQLQQQSCDQVSTAANLLSLENVSVFVQKNSFPSALLFSKTKANVDITGGTVSAYNSCIQDASDGFIQSQQQACSQVANAGNIVTLTGVGVTVF
ncbi:hypothetical protein GCM10010435_40060 [Winogradskya consettensis]|uniref:Uncharacterized protein n=2 Tax=Winogradskya TaxID=3240235 RepID=A0A919VU57_9ACTN|nr:MULTISPECIES: hypothetical protein [Actinoplanes]GIE23554.1 hypothetical protein Ahu01nite_066560 [Actinoplanes humidus]GIM69628.1 hypothetical protein Aco04nite_16190 [Actinoplanes consettensis]